MSRSVFVTSTGTEKGKTVISRAILECWTGDGDSAGYYKPVASGCEQTDWGYRSPDEVEMIRRKTLPEQQVTASIRLKAPLSPDQAALREDRRCSLEPVLEDWQKIQTDYDRWVVEGIGGVAVPFNQKEDVRTLIDTLSLPVVLVVGGRLGTISYTRTAVSYLRRKKIDIRGILLTPDTGEEIVAINREHLRSIYPEFVVESFPGWTDDRLADVPGDRIAHFLKECELL